MAKDSYWFKHDSTASRDLKLMQIKAIHGHAGIGIYWCIIEVLREQNGYMWNDDESSLQILAKVIDCDLPKFNGFITDCKRIKLLKSDGTHLYSERLIRDMEVWETKKKNRVGTKRERNANGIVTKQEDKRRVDKNKNIYMSFISSFNEITGKKYRGDSKSQGYFNARTKEGFTIDEMKTAVQNAIKDQFHKDNDFKYITPEFILRADKLNKFLNSPNDDKPKTIVPYERN